VANPNHPAGPAPREAISYLRRKGVRTGFSYQDVWAQEHGMAFTVAKMTNLSLLADVQRSLVRAQQDGTPFEQWRKELSATLVKRGWWGEKDVFDPKTGKTVKAQLGNSRRLETIWRVNMGQASQAGVWERGQRSTSHPYVIYLVGPSKTHREQHLAWNGTLLPKDDPFWAAANPRNGWGCKCYTRFVSRAQYRRYTAQGVPGGGKVRTQRPKLQQEIYHNDRTGKTHVGYQGIDPGFEYNPGTSREQQLRTQWQDRDAVFAQDMRPKPGVPSVRDRLEVDPAKAKSQRIAALEAIRAIERVHGVRIRPTIPVHETDAPYQGQFVCDPKDRTKPLGINLSKRHPDKWQALTMVHEVGHFIDHSGLSNSPARLQDHETVQEQTPEMWAVMEAIRHSPTYLSLNPYLKNKRELWARAYSQYIAWRSGSSTLKAQLDKILTHDRGDIRVRQWPYDEFAPIATEIDRLLMAKGWARRKLP